MPPAQLDLLVLADSATGGLGASAVAHEYVVGLASEAATVKGLWIVFVVVTNPPAVRFWKVSAPTSVATGQTLGRPQYWPATMPAG